MGGPIPQIALYVFVGGAIGVMVGLLIGNAIRKRRIDQLIREGQARLADVTRQRDQLATEFEQSQATIETLSTHIRNDRTALKAAREKSKRLATNVLTLRTEREETKIKISTIQKALNSVNQQTAALQREFDKARDFYKGELAKAIEKRKALEVELESVRSEHESFARLVESSILEHGSPDAMITAAQLRLGQIDVLERNVNKLEVENAQLRDEVARIKREYKVLEEDLSELDELRINNKQLVRCVESLESARKQHEDDAERYRDQVDQSEQLSETLRLRLSDLEKNFADMERQQHHALRHAREDANIPTTSSEKSSSKKTDDLQHVVGLARPSNRR